MGYLLATALLGGIELLFLPPRWPGDGNVAVWLLGVLILQAAARPTPYFGSFQLQMAWGLVCWGSDLTGPVLLVLALTGLWARPRPWELTADSLAVCLVLPLWKVGPIVAGALVMAAQTILLQWLARQTCGRRYPLWLRLELKQAPLRWAAWWLACAALWLQGPEYLRLLWLPGFLGLCWGAHNAVFHVQTEAARLGLEKLTQTQDELRRALWQPDSPHVSGQEQLLQERLSYLQDLRQVGPLLGEWLGGCLQLRSAAFYTESLECLWASSPESSRLESVLHWLGGRPLDSLPQVLDPPWLEAESQAVLVPLEGCWLYLGRGAGWQAQDFRRLGRVVEVVRPWVRGLLSGQNQHFSLDSPAYLLHCCQRLLQPLQLPLLWEELLSCLGLCFQLQAAGWLDEGKPLADWGLEPPAAVLAWAQSLSGAGYLYRRDFWFDMRYLSTGILEILQRVWKAQLVYDSYRQ